MTEDVLTKQALDLIKLGILSLDDFLELIRKHKEDNRYKSLRNEITGKYTTIIQKDANMDDIRKYCDEHNINLMTAFYNDENKNALYGFELKNDEIKEVYNAVYQISKDRNKQIKNILNQYNINYKTTTFLCDYRENGSGNKEHEKIAYKEQLYISKEDFEKIINMPELEYLKDYIETGNLPFVKDYNEPEQTSNLDMIQQMMELPLSDYEHRTDEVDSLLNHNLYDSVYDAQSDRIIINGSKEEIEPFLIEYFPETVSQIIYAKDRNIFLSYVERNQEKEIENP